MPEALISLLTRFNDFVARHFGVFAGGTAILGVVVWVFCLVLFANQANGWVIVLYSLPVAVQAGGLCMLPHKLSHTSDDSVPNRMSPKEDELRRLGQ